MILNTLKLYAFGPFTDKILDLSGTKHGLHMVCGVNEAGKSSTLRALIGLFYGFGHIVEDAWLHENKNLSVGGDFLLPDNTLLRLTRYKRRKNDLIDEETDRPFAQADLDKHLGRMGKDAFQHTFGISHDSLRMGVDSVLAAGGDLGQALFAATSGLNTLKNVMTRLDEQQGGLFSPRGRNPRINAAISNIKSLRKQQREASASHHHWKKLKKEVDGLFQQEKQFEDDLKELSKRISLLSRHRDAIKHVALRRIQEKELNKIGDVPELGPNFSHDRVETQMALKQTAKVLENLRGDIEEIDQKLKTLAYDERIIANEALIENLAGEAKVHVKAKKDSQSLRARMYQHQDSAKKALGLLRPGLTIEDVETLRLSRSEVSRIFRLVNTWVKLKESHDTMERMLKKKESGLVQLQKNLTGLGQAQDTEELEACLARAADHGKLEDRIEDASKEAALLEENINMELSSLGLWKGGIGELERLSIPIDETMRKIENSLVRLDNRIKEMKNAGRESMKKLGKKQSLLSEMTRLGRLPSMNDLINARRIRDMGWNSILNVWLKGAMVDTEFMAHFPECNELADAYAKSVASADETSDILREDAEAVAQAEALRKDINEFESDMASIEQKQDALSEKRKALWEDWLNLWASCNISPLSPREMIAWAVKVEALKQKAEVLRKQKGDVLILQQNMEKIKSEVTSALLRIHINVPEELSYSALISFAGKKLTRIKKLEEEYRKIESRIGDISDEIKAHQERKNETEIHKNQWALDWANAVAKLGFKSDAGTEDVQEFVQAMEDIFAQLEKAKDLEIRNTAIHNDYQDYSKRVGKAVSQLAPDIDIEDNSPGDAALELNARLKRDREKQKECLILKDEMRKKNKLFSSADESLAALNEKMRLIFVEAWAETQEQLPEIEKRAANKTKLVQDLDKVNERLAELALGQDVEQFIEDVTAHDPDELHAQLNQCELEKKQCQEAHKKIVAQLALAQKDLESIGGESKALAIAEQAEGIAAQIQEDVHHYVKLKMASAVLTKAIERYRQSNQSPVLEAAGVYFNQVTKGSFAGLRADYNEKGDPVIKALRPDRSLLTVKELSDGTRDQLFLSLRLGGLSRYIRNNGPIPFIIDDVLVHFDDERSAASLSAMADLAQETQIIFFTHHYHLIKLAKNTLSDEAVQIHYL